MSRRRNKLNTKVRRQRGKKMIERLEDRLLFNTIITDSNPLTSTPDTQSLEYKDARGNNVRITVHGDVSAEFIFAKVDKNGGIALRDAVGTTMVGTDGKLATNTEDGRDLFHIYIAQATIDSYISIAEVPAFDAKNRPMIPFTGSVTFRIQPNATTNTVVTTSAGDVLLGARTRADAKPDTAQNNPIESISFQGLGLLAKTPNGKLVAGITTAAGVSIGNILIGGTVTGEVTIQGSMQSFYCGTLLTGTTGGQTEGVADDPGNFYIGGDIRNILVMGSAGTTGIDHTFDGRSAPNYYSGTNFNILGKVGEIKVGGDYAATGIIHNNTVGLGLRTRQQELEIRVDPGLNRGDFTEFENGQFGDNQGFFTNDTFAQAQFLGSINSKQLGNNTIQLNGLMQTSTKFKDTADMYAVPLMAGQTITVRVLVSDVIDGDPTDIFAGVFDADQRLVATDESDVSDVNATGTSGAANLAGNGVTTITAADTDVEPMQHQLFSVTATKPGIYYIAVGEVPPFTADNVFGIEQPYQLQVTGVGNVGLGGLVVSGTIFAPSSDNDEFIIGSGGTIISQSKVKSITGFIANIDVERGDLGAVISLDDFIVSPFTDGFNALDDGGQIRDVEAASLGQANGISATDNTITRGDAAQIEAVTGSIGMIRSTGTTEGTDLTYFNDLQGIGGVITGSNTFAQPTVIGGDIQYVESPTDLITNLECNGSIGVIQAHQFGVNGEAGSVSVNVDGKGKPGTIDLIDVTGDLGTLNSGGPVISTNAGGNVRYIHISDTSTAYRPLLFGGSQPEQTAFAQGQEADFTDDSGTNIRIVPTFEDETDANGNIILDANSNPISNSGTLTILTYPIARSLTNTGGGGVVIIRADCTRGMQVTSSGSTAEIGSIRCGQSTGVESGFLTGTTDQGPGLVSDASTDTFTNDFGPDGVQGTGDDPFELDPNTTDTMSIDLRGSTTDVFSIEGPNFAFVRNRTDGEIVNTRIGTTALLEAQNLGWAHSVVQPGMAIEGSTDADNPGSSESEGTIYPFDHAKNAIVINGGSESTPAVLTINARQSLGNVMIVGRAQDINANSDGVGTKGVFEGIIGVVYAKGQLRNVNVGEGLATSGTGEFAHAGLYANASGVGSSINGLSVGLGRIEEVRNQGLDSDIRGNIIAAGGVGSIDLNNGSIIDADIQTPSASGTNGAHTATGADFTSTREYGGLQVVTTTAAVDHINISGSGGIIGSVVNAANIGDINVGGFGVINTFFTTLGAGRFQNFTVGGLGMRGVVWRGGQSLQSVNILGDGHRLKTSSFEPSVLLSGSLKIDPFLGIRPNGLTDLYLVTGTTPATPVRKGGSNSGTLNNSIIAVSRDVGSISANTLQGDTFNVANNIGSLNTGSFVDTSQMTAGSINSIMIGGDVTKSSFSFSGPVTTVHVGRSFKGSSNLSATGPNGSIGNVVVDNTLYGNIASTNTISSIRVGTFYGSQGTHAGKDITKFVVGQDFVTGAVLNVKHNLSMLIIGGDFEDGATIKAGILGTTTIIGANDGDFVTI